MRTVGVNTLGVVAGTHTSKLYVKKGGALICSVARAAAAKVEFGATQAVILVK